MTSDTTRRRLIFGIYPGGMAGTESGLTVGPPDDPERIHDALSRLAGPDRAFVVRGYVHFTGAAMRLPEGETPHPPDVGQYAADGRKLDLVLCFRDPAGDVDAFAAFAAATVERLGPRLATLQIAEEPNLYLAPGSGDGAMPNVREAILGGVVAAKETARRLGRDVSVGFNAVPSFGAPDDFWEEIGRRADRRFLDALDYVGVDFFPDVFHPVALEDLNAAIGLLLDRFRDTDLAAAGIPRTTPIHVAENGWPTGPDRPYDRQAAVIEEVVRAVHARAATHNVTHYEIFSLRDADSSNANMFHQFGLMRDDYTPKPAFDVYRRLIAELGADRTSLPRS